MAATVQIDFKAEGGELRAVTKDLGKLQKEVEKASDHSSKLQQVFKDINQVRFGDKIKDIAKAIANSLVIALKAATVAAGEFVVSLPSLVDGIVLLDDYLKKSIIAFEGATTAIVAYKSITIGVLPALKNMIKFYANLALGVLTLGGVFGKLSRRLLFFLGLPKIILGVIGAVKGLISGIKALYRNVEMAAKRFGDLQVAANKLSIDPSTYKQIVDIYQAAGIAAEDTELLLQNFQRNLGRAQLGLDGLTEAYRKLGIAIKDENDQFRSTQDVYRDLIARLGSMTSESERMAAAVKFLGDGYSKADIRVANFMKRMALSAEEIKKFERLYFEAGADVDNAMTKYANNMKRRIDLTRRGSQQMIDDMSTMFLKIKLFWANIKNRIVSFAHGIAGAIGLIDVQNKRLKSSISAVTLESLENQKKQLELELKNVTRNLARKDSFEVGGQLQARIRLLEKKIELKKKMLSTESDVSGAGEFKADEKIQKYEDMLTNIEQRNVELQHSLELAQASNRLQEIEIRQAHEITELKRKHGQVIAQVLQDTTLSDETRIAQAAAIHKKMTDNILLVVERHHVEKNKVVADMNQEYLAEQKRMAEESQRTLEEQQEKERDSRETFQELIFDTQRATENQAYQMKMANAKTDQERLKIQFAQENLEYERKLAEDLDVLKQHFNDRIISEQEYDRRLQILHDEQDKALKTRAEAQEQALAAAAGKKYSFGDLFAARFGKSEAISFWKPFEQQGLNAIDMLGNSWATFLSKGKAGFGEFIKQNLMGLSQMIAKVAVLQAIQTGRSGAIGGLLNIAKSADGNVFTRPGLSVFGEAGPEAVMPLARNRQGKLGVVAQGGGGIANNITVNYGGSAQENPNLGRQIASIIDAKMRESMRNRDYAAIKGY